MHGEQPLEGKHAPLKHNQLEPGVHNLPAEGGKPAHEKPLAHGAETRQALSIVRVTHRAAARCICRPRRILSRRITKHRCTCKHRRIVRHLCTCKQRRIARLPRTVKRLPAIRSMRAARSIRAIGKHSRKSVSRRICGGAGKPVS